VKIAEIFSLCRGGEATIFGLGAAVQKAMELALKLRRKNLGRVELHTTTHTVELVDDLEPNDDTKKATSQTRSNSSVKILAKMKKGQYNSRK